MKSSGNLIPGSFRDPNGFLFTRDGALYRQINHSGREDFEYFLSSGLYNTLVENMLLIPHQKAAITPELPDLAFQIIQPERIPFISYPYEWCFSQLKDAALVTLKIQRKALEFGMSLKDSSAYNIQFCRGKPRLIDTLSFEHYQEGQPWVAYRQFCQHFLAPLALMAYCDTRLITRFRIHIDGLPLELVSNQLPKRTYLRPGLLMHLHLHAKSTLISSRKEISKESVAGKVSQRALEGLIDSLEGAVTSLDWKPRGTDWADYYSATNYTDVGFENKKQIVIAYLRRTGGRTVWDLGANTGEFSRLAAGIGMYTISFDLDPAAVEVNYRNAVEENNALILPLLMDLRNPSPALGWHNSERSSLLQRGPANAVLALALVHHLVIGNNAPFDRVARFLRDAGEWLIVEFVPKHDTQVQKMLALREDIFLDYTQERFEAAFREHYEILDQKKVVDSDRRIYLMKALESS